MTTVDDKKVVVLEGCQPDAFSAFALSLAVGSLEWRPHTPGTVVASMKNDSTVVYEVRMNGSAPLFHFDAHAGAVSSIPACSVGTVGVAKLWDLKDNSPVCITF